MLPRASQLESFTDIFRDDVSQENISQPLSLSSSIETVVESPTKVLARNSISTSRPLKGTGQHGEFRSVEEIDPKYRCLFTFPYFNLVQSRVIEDALYSDKSLVLCAPTGSGKTVAFEMAMCQLLMEIEDTQYTGDFKIIYMAPVKAVCNERLTEWYPKLTKLGLLCIEVTGDTEVDFSQLKPYKLIITTPEKWDILTRRWRDHRGLVEMIKLFLIDEVHILNDETRGPVLEAVVSRMKTIESAAQSAHRIEQLQRQYQGSGVAAPGAPPRIRFVAVSATISNPEDVAHWLGTNEKPAVFYKFGDECRPVRLRQIVEGYPCAEGTSIFKFDIILNYKLWSIIQKYYNGKPTLIFCNTRKSVALTAETLSREITVSFNPEQKAKLTALASTLKNKKLQVLAMSGVGCHHAGLLYEERVNIERAFRNRDLPILITTTTLAMGVNLPAHLVIIKNTQQYVGGSYQEYSISTVLQMVGRAGRPQFDTEATAVIMTRLNDKARYQSLVGGSEPLQSYLHKRIAENLNSEAALGTVTDVAQCVEWLRSTFLYVRAAKDPKRYLGLPPAAPTHLILKKIEELCVKAMNSLASSGLITMDEASCIESTEAGRLMSVYYLDVETMKNIMKIDGTENLETLLWLVCESHELSDMHLRMDERRCLNLLNRNKAAATIRFPMKGKISTRQMKMNCIIQAVLGCLHIPEPALNQEAMKVMKIAGRVCTCLVRYMSRPELASQQPQCFSAVLNSIVLAKCIEAHLWENSPYVSRQLKGIGPTFSTLLASAGVTSFMLLEESHPRDLERIMNKGPPAGNILRKQVSLLPKYQLTATPIDGRTIRVQLMLLNHGHLSENMDQLTAGASHKSYLIAGDTDNNLLLLTPFTDRDLISVYDGIMNFEITRKLSNEHKILIHCISSNIAGIDAQTEFTFLELVSQLPRESSYFASSNKNVPTKNNASRQTSITDVYKERKRKPNSEIDITQSKEKKKRENTLTEKLKALKESFGKTSKELKKDIDKSAETSTKLLNDLLENRHANSGQKLQDAPDTIVGCPVVDLTNVLIHEPLQDIVINEDDNDYIDDSEIDNILSNIESEISGNGRISNETISTPMMQDRNLSVAQIYEIEPNMHTAVNIFKEPIRKTIVKDTTKRKNINTKSNFSFIDLIEKKANSDDKDMEVSKSSDSGFSETIKSQIRDFLQRTNKSKLTSPVINENLYNTDQEELPAVHVKRYTSTETAAKTQNIEEHLDIGIDQVYNEPEIETPLSKNPEEKDENDLFNHIDDTELPPVFVKSIEDTEINMKANRIHIKQDNTDAGIVENESKNCIHDELPTEKKVLDNTVRENDQYRKTDVDKSNCLVEKNLETIKYEDETKSDDNRVFDIEKIVMPFHKSLSFENKVGQLDATTDKTLISYNCDIDENQSKSVISDAFKKNLTVPIQSIALQSSEVIRHKPIILSNLLVPNVNKMEVNYSENALAEVKINRTLIPCQLNDENAMIPFKDSYVCDNRQKQNCSENIVKQLDMACLMNASLIPHRREQEVVQYNNESRNASSTGLVVPDPIVNISSTSDLRSNPSKLNNNSKLNTTQQDVSPYTFSFQRKTVCVPNPHNFVKRQLTAYSDDTREFRENRYSYTATKIDVCTKNNADHQLRITRKLKVDLDITESVTQEKININKMKQENENLDVESVGKNEVGILTENDRKFILEGKFEDCSTSLDESNNVLVVESDTVRTEDEKKEDTCVTDEKATHCTATNNVGSILQKYSKILSKPGIYSTPVISRINKNHDDISTSSIKTSQTRPNTKSRRPFRIRDIHTIDPPTNNIIKASRSAAVKEPKQFLEFIKEPKPYLECIKQTRADNEVKSPNLKIEAQHDFDFNEQVAEINERSFIESPISVLSLDLDPTENIKDDSMFNPKALLQYFNTDSKSEMEVIAPPAEFCDASAYSPTMPTQQLTDHLYENYACDTTRHSIWDDENNLDNTDILNNSSLHSSPKKVETWTLSRHAENPYYMSQPQPMSSVPWSISQRAGSSQASSGFSTNRARLGQFKFVRKKPLRPR